MQTTYSVSITITSIQFSTPVTLMKITSKSIWKMSTIFHLLPQVASMLIYSSLLIQLILMRAFGLSLQYDPIRVVLYWILLRQAFTKSELEVNTWNCISENHPLLYQSQGLSKKSMRLFLTLVVCSVSCWCFCSSSISTMNTLSILNWQGTVTSLIKMSLLMVIFWTFWGSFLTVCTEFWISLITTQIGQLMQNYMNLLSLEGNILISDWSQKRFSWYKK